MGIFFVFRNRVKTGCASLSLSTCSFYFLFLNKFLILEEERLVFSPLSLESWEEVLWSLCSLPTLRNSESREVREG